MTKLYFIAAVYNEEREIGDLLAHVYPLVQGYCIVDDGSTDRTMVTLNNWYAYKREVDFRGKQIPHTGLPETVKNEALKLVPDGSWVLMLDADERLVDGTIDRIKEFFSSDEYLNYDYVYFQQLETIDGVHVRTFQKAKLFKKEAITFPLNNIHADDQFTGKGVYKEEWLVLHRKTTNKQVVREQEYLTTYKRLLDEGLIDEGRYEWLKGLHHYVK